MYVGAVPYIAVPYKKKGDAVKRMPWFEYTGRVRRDVIVVFVSLRWGSPSQQENFFAPPPHRSADAAQPYTRLCVGSADSKDQQVRSRHLVQVQSPISTAYNI